MYRMETYKPILQFAHVRACIYVLCTTSIHVDVHIHNV